MRKTVTKLGVVGINELDLCTSICADYAFFEGQVLNTITRHDHFPKLKKFILYTIDSDDAPHKFLERADNSI